MLSRVLVVLSLFAFNLDARNELLATHFLHKDKDGQWVIGLNFSTGAFNKAAERYAERNGKSQDLKNKDANFSLAYIKQTVDIPGAQLELRSTRFDPLSSHFEFVLRGFTEKKTRSIMITLRTCQENSGHTNVLKTISKSGTQEKHIFNAKNKYQQLVQVGW